MFSDNWNLYDMYMCIHGHWVLESMLVAVWPRIFTEMWSNFRMRFVITLRVLMKSFQKSPEMPVITCVLLSPPWTDGKVLREIASEWCLLIRISGLRWHWFCGTLALVLGCRWKDTLSYSVLQTGFSLILGSVSKYRLFTCTIQMTLSSNLGRFSAAFKEMVCSG